MFCTKCGQQLNPYQTTCPHCGAEVHVMPPAPAPVPAGPPGYPPAGYGAMPVMAGDGRVHRHLQIVGILWLVYAATTVMGWLIAIPFLTGRFGGFSGLPWGHGHAWAPFAWMPPWLIPFITAVLLVRATLQVVAGVGLLRRARWGRVVALVAAVLSIVKLFLGTLLAIYTLWVLLPSISGAEYDEMATEA